ncbi:MAG TPA: hypothetical protein VGR07_23765 [Thermoanaerobaculia bacterium]|jgi:hypothetical protein|nr:hypothetical protein [Thermoanaerobaculia bacterium]
MPNSLAQFMIALSEDPAEMAEFAKDPNLVLSRSGLTAADREVAKSGDVEAIYRHLGLDATVLRAESNESNESNSNEPPPKPRPPHPPHPKPEPPKPEPPKRDAASL